MLTNCYVQYVKRLEVGLNR